MMDFAKLFDAARAFCVKRGYSSEIEAVRGRKFETATADAFLSQYIYVVLNAGMRNQVAEKIYARLMHSGDLKTIRHQAKRHAIECVLSNYTERFTALTHAADKLAFLDSLPFIGPITKYHLARNLGMDVAKPDRHLVNLARHWGFSDVHEMCRVVAEQTGERIGVVDVVLWRAYNLGWRSRDRHG